MRMYIYHSMRNTHKIDCVSKLLVTKLQILRLNMKETIKQVSEMEDEKKVRLNNQLEA